METPFMRHLPFKSLLLLFLAVGNTAFSAPAVEITPDLTVPVNHEFTLRVTGGASGDAEVTWEQLSGPAWLLRASVSARKVTLTPDWKGRYIFRCTVRSRGRPDESAEVAVTVTPQVRRPVARISGPLSRTVGAGEWVYLSGEESYDPARRSIEYYWAQVSGPTAKVKKGTGRKPLLEFMPEEPGRYVFSLQVRAGRDISEPEVAVIMVPFHPDGGADHSPSLVVSAPETAVLDRKVRLDASASKDVDGDEVDIIWHVVSQPDGSGLKDHQGPIREFTPSVPGRYRFQVTASAGDLSNSREVVITAAPGIPENTTPASKDTVSIPEGREGPVNVDWRTVMLEEALFELSRRYNVDLMISPDWLAPSRFRNIYLDLKLENASLEVTLTWLARTLGGHYRKTAPRRYWMGNGYGFLREEPEEAFSVMMGPSFEGVEDPAAWLESAIKPVILALGRTELLSTGGRRIGGVLPASAASRLKSVASAATASVFPSNSTQRPHCRALGSTVKLDYEGTFLRDIMWDLGKQAGVNIGFDTSRMPSAGRKAVTVKMGDMPLREALLWAMKEAGLLVINVDSPHSLWLDQNEVLPPGETLWDTARTAAFDLGPLLKKGRITPTLLSHLIQRRVSPSSWKDPASTLLFLPRRNRLIAVNHPWILSDIQNFLERIDLLDYRHWSTGN